MHMKEKDQEFPVQLGQVSYPQLVCQLQVD